MGLGRGAGRKVGGQRGLGRVSQPESLGSGAKTLSAIQQSPWRNPRAPSQVAVKAWHRHGTLTTFVRVYTSGLHASLLMLKTRLQDGELGEMLAWPYETCILSLFLSQMLSHYYKVLAGEMAIASLSQATEARNT